MRISARYPLRFSRWLCGAATFGTALALLAVPPCAAQPAAQPEDEETRPEAKPDASPQEEEAAAAPEEGAIAPSPGSEVIEIRGERRTESAQQEAVSITQFTQEALDTFGIQDVQSLQDFVPSLHIGNVGQAAIITLRGVGLENITQIGEASVLFEVDGIPLGRPTAALQAAFFDLGNLDVTRGPQGTLGGRQSTGGKIGLYAQAPRPDLEMYGDFQYGTKNQKLTRGVLNVPLAEELLMTRLSINHEDRQGYQTNILFGREADADDAENLSIRGQLMGLPADGLEWRVIGTYDQQHGVGPATKVIGPLDTTTQNCPDDGPPQPDACPGRLIPPNGSLINPVDPRVSASDHGFGDRQSLDPEVAAQSRAPTPGFQDNFQYGFIPTVKVDLPELPLLGSAQFGLVGGYVRNHTEGNFDLDGTNAPVALVFFKSDAKQRSVEGFLKSVEAEYATWKAGIFYYHEEVDGSNDVGAGGTAISASSAQTVTQSSTESLAGYGQTTLFLLDNLELTMGLRYSRETKPAYERRGIMGESSVSLKQTWTAWTPRMEFTWRVTDTSHLTVGAARGFKPGGFNLNSLNKQQFDACTMPPFSPAAPCPLIQFNEETVWQYQVLSKNQLFDDTLDLNLTGFWTRYSNYQACQITSNGFLCDSGGDALLRGVEVETKWEPITGLRVNANFDFLDTSVDKFRIVDPTIPPGAPKFNEPLDISGNQLPRSPKFAVNTGIQYEFELGPYGFLTPRAQFRWQDKAYFRVFNSYDKNDKYYWADVKLTWRSADERWSLEGALDNLTDVDVVNNVLLGPTGAGAPVLAFYRPPRTWSIKAGFRWF